MPDKMSGIERSSKILSFQRTDRVPILGEWILHPKFFQEVTGANNFWDSPRKIAIEGYRKLGTDAIVALALPYGHQEFRSYDMHGFLGNMKKYKSPEDIIEYIKNLLLPEILGKNLFYLEVCLYQGLLPGAA